MKQSTVYLTKENVLCWVIIECHIGNELLRTMPHKLLEFLK